MSSSAEAAARAAAERACYQVLADHAVLGTLLIGPDDTVVDHNQVFERLAGAGPDGLRGRPYPSLFDDQVISGTPATLIQADGRHRSVDVLTHDLPHGYRLLIAIDRSAIDASDERFRRAFADAGLGMALLTREGRNLRVNAALTDILGYNEAELLALSCWDVVHPDDLPQSRRVWQRFDDGETAAITEEKRYIHKQGHPVWVTVTLSPMRIATDDRRLFLAQVEDISERRRLAATLVERDEQLRTALDANRAAAFSWDSASNVLWYSDSLPELLGLEPGTAPQRLTELILTFAAEDRARIEAALLPRGAPPRGRFVHRGRIRLADGVDRYVELSGAHLARPSGAVVLRAIARDVTEELAQERARVATETRLDRVLDAVQDGIWDWDGIYNRTYYSRHYFALLGYEGVERVAGEEVFTELLHPEDRDRVLAAIAQHHRQETGNVFTTTFRMRRSDGTWAWIESRGRVVERDSAGHAIRTVGTHRDVSDTRALEEQFRQAQKMEAIGKLAGGIAHDFNNLLTTISATAELLCEDLAGDTRQRDVESIALAAARARTLTRQLLAFSRQEVERVDTVEIGEVIRTVEPLLSRMMAAGQELQIDQPTTRAWVHLDPAQLELALLNLVGNARDAMAEGGRVAITLTCHSADDSVTGRAGTDWRHRSHLRLAVADNGTGMSEDVVNRVFEPFFTTKPIGEGTGLGLATVYAFVRRSGGEISVASAPGAGTTFTIVLPTVPEPDVPDTVTVLRPDTTGPTPRILLVDDDPTVRATIRRLLERHGFRVHDVPGAAHALVALESGRFDLVLSDHAMPGQTGEQLLATVVERWPEVRVVLMSGFTDGTAARRAISGRRIPFLAKPFTAEELIEVMGSPI
jgi:PAS domain S-box-containing protein